MERLTIKKDDGRYYINQLSIDNSYSAGINCLYGKPIDKLAEFEDFMEEQGFESLELLKATLKMKTQSIKGFEKLYQENQALKDRWEKLKEYAEKHFEEEASSLAVAFRKVLVRMQELEDRQ